MIDDQLREYADLLKLLYGDGALLHRYLSKSLTDEELAYVMDVVQHQPTASSRLISARDIKSDSHRRAKARLAEKLDSVVLAHNPAERIPRRIEVTRTVFAQLATAGVSVRAELHSIAKHKLHVAVRQSALADLIEAKLFALRKLYIISWRESNTKDFLRYQRELIYNRQVYDTVISISLLHGKLVFENSKKRGRQQRLHKVARECFALLQKLDRHGADPIIILAACPLATAVAQIQNNIELATTWLSAYKRVCIECDLWDDSHRRDWLLQQLAISEYFGKKSGITQYIKQLVKLTRVGSSQWFMLTDQLSDRALQSGSYGICAEIILEAVAHPSFRRQRVDVQRSILHRAGYASVFASDTALYRAYRRRRRSKMISTIHMRIVDFLHAIQSHDMNGAFSLSKQLLFTIDAEEVSDKTIKMLRTIVTKSIKRLGQIELVFDARKQRIQLSILHQELRESIAPLVVSML